VVVSFVHRIKACFVNKSWNQLAWLVVDVQLLAGKQKWCTPGEIRIGNLGIQYY